MRRADPVRALVAWLVAALAACDDGPSAPTYTPSGPCDSGLAMNASSAASAAMAMGICDGFVSAAWVDPLGGPATVGGSFDIGHGLLPSFGASFTPREGAALLALSTGTARAESQAGYAANLDKGYATPPAPGFPQNDASCAAASATGRDGIGLRVDMVAPAGVRSLSFDYAFFTRDYPTYVCTSVIDQAAGFLWGISGSSTAVNYLLDSAGKAMYPSATSLRICTASTGYSCPLGAGALAGTGMSGSTGWLTTPDLPVTAGDTIRALFTIWDTADGIIDSSLLLDGFTWNP